MNALAPTRLQELTVALQAKKAEISPCGREAAARYATVMLGGYTDIKVMDPKTFSIHLEALFSEYPLWLLEKAQKEIPRVIHKYKLDIASIQEWLEERMRDRRVEYMEAFAAHKRAEDAERDRAHAEQVAKDKAEFEAWEAEHPGGTMRQFLGLAPYTTPAEPVAKVEAWEMGPYQSAGHLVSGLVKAIEEDAA